MVGFFWVAFWFLRLLGLTKIHVFQALSCNSEVWKLNFLQEKAEILVQCLFPGAGSLRKKWNNVRCNKKHWGWQYCRRDGKLWLCESSNDERSIECQSELELLCLYWTELCVLCQTGSIRMLNFLFFYVFKTLNFPSHPTQKSKHFVFWLFKEEKIVTKPVLLYVDNSKLFFLPN